MWKAKVWIEGKWLWFTSSEVTEEEAENDFLAQAIEFFKDWYKDENVNEAMFVIDIVGKE